MQNQPIPKTWKHPENSRSIQKTDILLLPGSSKNPIYVHAEIIDKLCAASSVLPQGFSLLVLSGMRTIEQQKKSFLEAMESYWCSHPDFDEAEVRHAVRNVASDPDYQPDFPEKAGCRISVVLSNKRGNPLVMGLSGFDLFAKDSVTRFYEKKVAMTPQETEILYRRRILFHAMSTAGFVASPHCYWQFDSH